ncbi:hypothetical protein [Myxococcus hansupus]|uniref:hypothetical protein n=1 Tax=Pseudomyxococcus hansupus TaxID=1297742 RepID=UPI000AE32A40|nr:hypothetical protein [Myxococcus hansupus]
MSHALASNSVAAVNENNATEALEITSLRITYSNASLGPRYERTTEWVLTHVNEEFRLLAAEVFAKAKVNGALSLKDFLVNPSAAPPRETLSREPRASGSGTHCTVMSFSNGQTLDLSDDSAHELSVPYGRLFHLTKEKGTVSETSGGLPSFIPKP